MSNIQCACNCGQALEDTDEYGRKRIYINHHNIGKKEKSPSWKGGRIRHSQGYILIHMPDHPFATIRGYVFEHRLVMEEYLGRYLNEDEVVHHINGLRHDNRIENLQLMDQKEHASYHMILTRRSQING